MTQTPKECWADPKKADVWIKAVQLKQKKGNPETNSTLQGEAAVLFEVGKHKDFRTILEVGAGDGRLIGSIANKYPMILCSSIDINRELSNYVTAHYPVATHVGEVAALPFPDNSFDLVFTHQVLQHVHPDEIERALSELQRVAKKEIWLMEGYDLRSRDRINGEMTHPADGGTFAYFFDAMPKLKIYEHYFLKNAKGYEISDVKIYKIRKGV